MCLQDRACKTGGKDTLGKPAFLLQESFPVLYLQIILSFESESYLTEVGGPCCDPSQRVLDTGMIRQWLAIVRCNTW